MTLDANEIVLSAWLELHAAQSPFELDKPEVKVNKFVKQYMVIVCDLRTITVAGGVRAFQ